MTNWLPYSFLFTSLMIFGTILSISSIHWLGAWIGLEVNLIGFLPILMYRGMARETESGVKYLIIQALGSGLLLTGSLMYYMNTGSFNIMEMSLTSYSKIMILMGIFLKLGMAPLHFWLPSTMAGMSWINCLLLATWQKIAPLILFLALTNSNMNLIIICAVMGTLIGGIGGINQTYVRALLAYSSIVHLSWMAGNGPFDYYSSLIYFLIYLTTTGLLFLFLYLNEYSQFQQFSIGEFMNFKYQWMFILLMLSLGGLPPLLGFLGKWLVIYNLSIYSPFLLLMLISGSMMSLFYYLSLSFSFTLNEGGMFKAFHNDINMKTNKLTMLLMNLLIILTLFGFLFLMDFPMLFY
uniref:NADH dehydrogenase subunit 2 n=1 Tax=Ennucula tenuis TaxID=106224 RepID=UPI00286D58ED|nr:NADH dehydrogenase subunit 2 [Ennucula tenuis]WLV28170.1 NADH dehydrogenase subunit 2 [Ennucula tenuis]